VKLFQPIVKKYNPLFTASASVLSFLNSSRDSGFFFPWQKNIKGSQVCPKAAVESTATL